MAVQRAPRGNKGFSLVELSIVLVILGLLVGGILGGQSLIRAAELRSVTVDVDKFQTALNSFRGKYNALPGDMSNAIDYWGAAHATPATCITTVGTGTQTCNGDGNGSISTFGTAGTYYERFRAWQQLSIAGLVEGSYSGTATSNASVPGTNVPTSKLSGGGWTLMHLGSPADGTYFASGYKNTLQFGAAVASDATYGPLLSPEDAFAIDGKIDDGKPGSGTVMGVRSQTTCLSTQVASTAAYILASSGSLCGLVVKMGF